MEKKVKRGRASMEAGAVKATVALPKELNEAIVAIAKKCYIDRISAIRLLLSEAVEARTKK